MIGLNVPEMVPENDTQELWQITGRLEAVKGYLLRRRTTSLATVYVDDVLAMLGFEPEK